MTEMVLAVSTGDISRPSTSLLIFPQPEPNLDNGRARWRCPIRLSFVNSMLAKSTHLPIVLMGSGRNYLHTNILQHPSIVTLERALSLVGGIPPLGFDDNP